MQAMQKIMIGDVRELWRGEHLGLGVYRFTASVAGWRAPELRPVLPVGMRVEVLQSMRGGERVLDLRLFAPSGELADIGPDDAVRLELWSYPRPSDAVVPAEE